MLAMGMLYGALRWQEPERNAEMTATYTVNCSILLTDVPLLDRPGAARNAGFDAVEFWWPFDSPTPPDADVTVFIRAIQDAGVQLTGLNFAAGDMPAGDRGILSNPASTQAFRDNVDSPSASPRPWDTRVQRAVRQPHRRIPHPRGTGSRRDREPGLRRTGGGPYRRDSTRRTRQRRTTVSVLTAADAIRVIDRVHNEHGVTNVRLLADLYHLHVNGDDITAAITDYGSRIGHVQIADAPGSR